jgi:hypothetical protein
MDDELTTFINDVEGHTDNNEAIAPDSNTEPTSGEDELDVEAVFKKPSSEAPKKSAAEVAEDKKEAWARKILEGKKTIEDLESTNSDKWMLNDVKKRLGMADTEADVEKKIREYDSSKQFKQDMATLKNMPIDVQKELVKLSKEYLELGVAPEKALRKVLEKSKTIIEENESIRKTRVEAGKLPSGQSSGGKAVYTADQVSKMDMAEYKLFREKELKGEVMIKL